MKKFWQIIRYFNYRIKAKSRYKVHSPFVYELVENVFRDKTRFKEYKELNKARRKLLDRTDKIEVMDFGISSGQKDFVVKLKVVGDIVKKSSHSKKQLELLFRLARYFKPSTILEFGTAVGISASYLGKGHPKAKLITMEGSMGLASVANSTLKKHGIKVELEVGEFDAILDHVIKDEEVLDMVFFDGNHRKKSTLKYFEKCLAKASENSVFIFDDIHWSPGMELAWKKIKANNQVTISIDLYWAGMVFFKKDIAKQDFIIRY